MYILIWIPQIIGQLLLWTYWWQVKEYRLDRFRSFFTSPSGRSRLRIVPILIKISLLLFSVFNNYFFWMAITWLFVLDMAYLGELLLKKLRTPVFTKRGKRIVATGLVLIFIVSALTFVIDETSMLILCGEFLLLLAPAIGIAWTTPIVNRIKRKELDIARSKLERIQPIVIGITGSYGKTTTKEFVATILSEKYKVEKTVKNENTDFGIARKVIENFDKKARVFIVEMGAYRKGDIERLCDMVEPQIGLITGIEPQHLDLFGDMKMIKQTKFELIKALPKKGIAIFNLTNPYMHQLYGKAKNLHTQLKVLGYYTGANPNKKQSVDIKSIVNKTDSTGIYFDLIYKKQHKKLYASILGNHFIENLTGAILIGKELGLSWEQIEKGVKKIRLPDGIMTKIELPYGSLLIDDSYNSTPKGFESAIDTLKQIRRGKRIIVSSGIIELGKREKMVHQKIGHRASFVEKFILTNSQFEKYIKEGMKDNEKVESIEDPQQLVNRVEKFIEKGSAILLEGRMPSVLMKFLHERKK